MKIRVCVCGRLKESYLRACEDEYLKRLRAYCTLAVIEYKSGSDLVAGISRSSHVYALDERGDLITSEQFAATLADEEVRGAGAPVVFAIGGPDGHTDALRARAQRTLSFGRMTIAHRLVRILLLEQIYRGFRIVRGEPYHRA